MDDSLLHDLNYEAEHARTDLIQEVIRLHGCGAIEPKEYSNRKAYLQVLLIQAMRNLADDMQPGKNTDFGKRVARELANLAKF